MTAAALLTILAVIGIVAGSILGQSRTFSVHLAAAGGGLLTGISFFWLVPEIAETTGWATGALLAIAFGLLLLLLDRHLVHTGQSPRHGVLTPLMAATALHSFVDGWSVSALAFKPLAEIAVPIGLALHKLPEGLALGWISRKATQSTGKAIVVSCAVEMATLVGAWVEPRADYSGEAAFGAWWTAVVLALVSGSFLFLGVHSVFPERNKRGVVPVFTAGCVVVGALAWAKVHG